MRRLLGLWLMIGALLSTTTLSAQELAGKFLSLTKDPGHYAVIEFRDNQLCIESHLCFPYQKQANKVLVTMPDRQGVQEIRITGTSLIIAKPVGFFTGGVYYQEGSSKLNTMIALQKSVQKSDSSQGATQSRQSTSLGKPSFAKAEKTATVFDRKSGLQWMRCATGQNWDGKKCQGEAEKIAWDEALKRYPHDSALGYDDWRLPTRQELETLLDSRYFPRVDPHLFPHFSGGTFWSSSPDMTYNHFAWTVSFLDGNVSSVSATAYNMVLLVRSGGAQ